MKVPNLWTWWKRVILGSLCAATLAACASTGTPIANYPNPAKALLVLDMQRDFLGVDARMPIEESSKEPLIEALNNLTNSAANKGIIVIYVRNEFSGSDIGNLFRNNAAVKGTPGSEIDSRVVMVSDIVFDKDQPDAFSNPKLSEFLVSHQVSEIAVTGVFADQCCYYTSLAALNRKYKVDYLLDGVGAASKENVLSASRSLKERGAVIETIGNWKM